MQAGLSPYQALRCCTSEAARFVEQADIWGTVAVGKRADLLLLSANPLTDIEAVRQLDTVLVNGFIFTRRDLDALLTQRESSVNAIHALLPTELDPLPGEKSEMSEETWHEHIEGYDFDRFTSRQSRTRDGLYLLEERYTSVRNLQRQTKRLGFTEDLVLAKGLVTSESLIGEEYWTIERLASGGYSVSRREADGSLFQYTFAIPALVPDEQLSHAFFPLFMKVQQKSAGTITLPALNLSSDGPQIISLKFVPVERGADAPEQSEAAKTWEVVSELPGEYFSHFYYYAPDGRLDHVDAGGVWTRAKN